MQTERPKLTKAGELAGVVSAIAALIGLVVAIFAWLNPQSPAEKSDTFSHGQNSSNPDGQAKSSIEPARPSTQSAAASGIGLAEVEISAGRENETPVPKRYTGERYRGAVAIPCGTGEAKDQFREVRYLIGGTYDTFHAVLAPRSKTQDQNESSDVQVEVFIDGTRRFNDVIATANETSLDLSVSGDRTLSFRLTCSKASALLLILQSSLV
jgi:hypothetical protein